MTAALLAASEPASAGAAGVLFSVEKPRYTFQLDEPASDLSGRRSLRARLSSHGSWHVNPDYPVRLEVHGAGLHLERQRFGRDEAARLSEAGFEFRLSFEPGSGEPMQLRGRLRFGLCRDRERCEALDQPFAARVP